MPKLDKKTKVKFEVIHETQFMIDMSRFMSNMDLGIERVTCPVTDIYSWTTTTKVDAYYIKHMSNQIRRAVEKIGGEVISIRKI